MDPHDNESQGGSIDLVSAALSQSGLGDLSGFDLEDPQEEQSQPASSPNGQPQQIEAVAVPLAQSTPSRPSQFITVRTGGPGPSFAQITGSLVSHAAQTPVKTQSSESQATRTPVTTKVVCVPSTASNSTSTVGHVSSELKFVQNLINGRIRINANPTNNGNTLIRTVNIPQNAQRIIVTQQGGKVTAPRRILGARNGQPVTTTVAGQVVQANIVQSPQQIQIGNSTQVVQVRKLVINQANGTQQVVHLMPHLTSTTASAGQKVPVASPVVQTNIINPVVGLPQAMVQVAAATPAPKSSSVVQPSVINKITSIGQTRTEPAIVINQSSLSGVEVMKSTSGSSLGSLHHSLSVPVLTSESSRSCSNSPVYCSAKNIPTVVTQKLKNYGGASTCISKDVNNEELHWRAFQRSSQSVTEDAEEESEELGHAETYAEYMPRKVHCGKKHPDQVVESSSLSSVEPPDVTYALHIPEEVMDRGQLSALQLEAITYACQRNEVILPCGERAGYLIGDGAGVGKGRTIAGIIYENYLLGRKRALWLSVSNDLKVDAERDLEDIGAKIKVHALNKFKYSAKITSSENGSVKKGVIFITYSSLIGESSQSESKYSSRMKQLLRWCGSDFDGPIIFDECHKAKNLCPSGSKASSTKTAMAVVQLQKCLPMARIVYASATGATEPRNMAYMTRLGLWGKGTPFPEFQDFINSVEKRGVGAMELVAMDMKLRGMYIARQLSFKGVSFKIEEIPLDISFRKMYDSSVEVWMEARSMFQKAADLIMADQRQRKIMWGQFWSAHQRFFKYLCISAKVLHCVRQVHESVSNNKCVVIGLQSTGEARTQEMVELEGGDLTDFVSTAKGVFQTLVEKHFPAADRNKTLGLLGLGILDRNDSLSLDSMGLKRKRDEVLGQNKRSKMDDTSDDDDEDINSEPSSDSDFSDLDSDLYNESDSDEDSNPFANGADSDDDLPWVKKRKQKQKASSKSKKDKGKQKKKKQKKKKSSCDEDDYCDSKLAKMNQMKKSCSVAGFSNTNATDASADNDPDNKRGMMTALAIKQELLNLVDKLGESLPPNTLDQLIDELGGPSMVAEMTGRKGRVVQNDDGIQYEARSEFDVPLEMLNLTEKDRFMRGDKDIAIISEAASSGISLQADRRAENQKRRVHITLELPWSADRAIQQFGRTHRSNQVSAPEYIFLISDLAGERRFASTVAKRLESLGALTHGDRRATESRDLSRFNIDNRFGRTALEVVLRSVVAQGEPLVDPPTGYTMDRFKEEVKMALEGVGLISCEKGSLPTLEKDYSNISKFLNRLLGMPCGLQNALFEYFNNTLNAVILDAKRSGKWDMGILDLGSSDRETVQRLETQSFWGNTAMNSAKTELSTILVERGLRWDDALNIWRKCNAPEEGFYCSTQERYGKRTAILVVLQGHNKKKEKVYSLQRPNTGLQSRAETIEEIRKKYKKVLPDAAEKCWIDQYNASASICSHAYWNGNCKKVGERHSCDIGLRTRQYHVLSGSVLSVWSLVETTLNSLSSVNTSKMQIVRLKTGDGQKIVGSLIPPVAVKPLVSMLKENSKKSHLETHHQTLQTVVNGLSNSFIHSSSTPNMRSGLTVNTGQKRMDTYTESLSSQAVGETSGNKPPSTPAEPLLSMPMLI